MQNEWINWLGGKCPVGQHELVQVITRSETEDSFDIEAHEGGSWLWGHDGGSADIVKYRLVVRLPHHAGEPFPAWPTIHPGQIVMRASDEDIRDYETAERITATVRATEQLVVEACRTSKPTNPKDGIGAMKLPSHLVSPIVKAYQAIAHYLGNVKYGAHNYIAGGARASIYMAALQHHIDAWWAGEDIDSDDGTPHLANAMACIGILIECKEAGNLNDDRPPSTNYARVRKDMEAMMVRIVATHGHRNPRHYSIADNAEIAKDAA